MSEMKIIQPIAITPQTMAAGEFNVRPEGDELVVQVSQPYLVYPLITNVPEDDYPAWSAGASYAIDDRVMHEHHCYRAAAASTGVNPATETEFPKKWVDLGVTNRWRMFDEKVGTVTENPELIQISMTPNSQIDAIAFFGVDAAAVSVTVFDGVTGVLAARKAAPVLTDGIDDWYAYFFHEIELREDFVMTGLPASAYFSLEVRLEKPAGIAKVGSVVMGRTAKLGRTLQGTSVGIIDYSRKERDEFGNAVIVERAYSKRVDFDLIIESRDISTIQRMLAKFRARPLVWIGSETMEAVTVYGCYKDFSIVIGGPSVSDCSITVEGLT